MILNSIATKTISLLLSVTILLSSCSSTTMIMSSPSGAKVYLNGESAGKTPYSHTDNKISGSTVSIKLVKEGYKTLIASFSKNEEVDIGAIIGGLFVFFPYFWAMKYKPIHNYELIPIVENNELLPKTISTFETKADRLREFKKLLDEKIITKEEFEIEKRKILEEK